ncbi:hypothetical protein GO009_02335 [Muricauda sp. TY007]|uniref:hypothetical protein n=1 Tax=Allomuricauda sp. TY007 TaxID=2683200 RepID=UPI0013C25732|nr:hypothetical protein [Muricauda sp. TY007]NDV14850.1 hypothetical protein [Muricauda sp. TY007]
MQPSKKRLFPVFFFLALTLHTFGQELKTYEGPLRVGPYSGKAVYQYTISDLDTIFDGDFELERSNLETLVQNTDNTFRFSGAFDKAIAHGPWQFEFGAYQTNSQSQVVGYQYRVLVSGVQEIGKGSLVKGKPDGTWTYTINQIKDSEIEKILFKSSISFDEGVPQQSFQIENDSSVLVGRLLRDGLAHDEWSFYATENVEDTENWFFEDGLLRRIQMVLGGTSKAVPLFDTHASNYKTIQLNAQYIALLGAVLDNDKEKSHISRLLEQNNGYYKKISKVLDHLGSPDFETNMKVKVPYYPLDSLQNKMLEQIASDYKIASDLSNAILGNSHLNIVKRTDSEAFFYYNVAEKIYNDFLVPLGTLVGYKEHEIVQHLKIPGMMQGLWPKGKPNTEIVVADEKGGQRTFSLPSSEEFGYESDDLLSAAAMATYAKMSLEYIKGSLASRLTNDEQLQILNGLEEELIALNNSLEKQVDSLPEKFPQNFRKAVKQLQNVADSSLTEYASIKNPNKKLEYGKEAKNCLSQLNALAITIKELPQRSEEIQKKYTDAVWNPFMANVMEEEVKKRIVNAYENILVPYFLTTITQELQCDNADNLNNEIIYTNQSILDLRDKDTRKLERKLRKEKRPKEVLKLLKEQSTSKNQ